MFPHCFPEMSGCKTNEWKWKAETKNMDKENQCPIETQCVRKESINDLARLNFFGLRILPRLP